MLKLSNHYSTAAGPGIPQVHYLQQLINECLIEDGSTCKEHYRIKTFLYHPGSLYYCAHKQALQVDLATQNANNTNLPIPYKTSEFFKLFTPSIIII